MIQFNSKNKELNINSIVKNFINNRLNRKDNYIRTQQGFTLQEIIIHAQNAKELFNDDNIDEIYQYILFQETKKIITNNYKIFEKDNNIILTSEFIPVSVILKRINSKNFKIYLDNYYYGLISIKQNNNKNFIIFDYDFVYEKDDELIDSLCNLVNILLTDFLNKYVSLN